MIRHLIALASKSSLIEGILFNLARLAGKKANVSVVPTDREIDAVYLWVDDSDERWRAKRGAYRPVAETTVATAKSRFRQFDELPFSIRMLAKNAPFIRKVFVVVDDQNPDLAGLGDLPFEIVVVNHTDFIPEQYLPTFNSRAITAHLHRIPGLSERFLYCNDDVFVGAPSAVTDWFAGDKMCLRFTETKFPARASLAQNEVLYQARWLAVDLARGKGWSVTDQMPEHAPYPLTKTALNEIWKAFPREMQTTSAAKFRAADAVLPELLAYYWAIGNGQAELVENRSYKYVPMNDVRGILPLLDLALKPGRFLTISLNDVSEVPSQALIDGKHLSKRYRRTLNYLLGTTR